MPDPQAGSLSGRLPFEGRRAFVMGGSGGIGRAVCLALARRGASLLVHGGSSRDRLDATLDELRASGGPAAGESEGFLLRIERPSDLLDRLEGLGRIDILALAFGPFLRSSLAETSASAWERLALLDLALPGALCSALLPRMAGRGWGRILLFGGSRTDSIRAYSSNAAYAAAKTGLAVLAKSLAAEGAASGVACLLACPGLVDTEYLDEAGRAGLRARAPGGSLLAPEAVAEAAVGLLAAEPCAASGAVLSLDGGLSL
jgi:NAD(P)-dependent dehydrogenase (short-subunit alcohol dehydrogenase family)